MSSIDVLKRELESLDGNIKHWLGNGADKSSKLIKHRLEQKKALSEAIEALERVGHVQDIRERVEKLRPSDYYKKYDSIPIELTASIKSDLIGFIDSLDKVKP